MSSQACLNAVLASLTPKVTLLACNLGPSQRILASNLNNVIWKMKLDILKYNHRKTSMSCSDVWFFAKIQNR